jgi:hypothetical protein
VKKLLSLVLIVLCLGACQQAAPTATPLPTPTATLVATRTPFVMPTAMPSNTPLPVTPSITPIVIDTFAGQGYEPPFTLILPAEWETHVDTAYVPILGELDYIPFAYYRGPVTGGTGTIVAMWNFRSVTGANPFDEASGKINLWMDGSRLLRSLVIETRCNVSVDAQRDTFVIGGMQATGTIWSAVGCPGGLPDTRGWYAGVMINQVSFLFYAFTDPIGAMDGTAVQEMQAVLDSIAFRMDLLVPPTPTPTP